MVTVLPCGPLAVMFEVENTAAAVDLAGWMRTRSIEDLVEEIVEIVPAARTVLVRCRDRRGRERVEASLPAYQPGTAANQPGTFCTGGTGGAAGTESAPLVEVPVVYDGADLGSVAATTGCSVAEVIERHSAPVYVGAFCGFAPGFTYLTGLDPVLHLPRRATPLPRIPAGSVAIAADFTGIYPTASPGGWHLLGHTNAAVWDITRPEPALMPPGCRVRFVRSGAASGR